MGTPALKVFNANVESKPEPPVGDVIKEHTPHLVVITEAYNCRDHLKKVAENRGYRLKQFGKDQGAEGPDIALLVKDGITIHTWEPMKMSEPWWGPQTGKKREPRVYPKLVLDDPDLPGDLRWKIIAVHFPPGGPKGGTNEVLHGKNKAAWAESRDRVVGWANDHPEGPFVLVGDINAHRDEVQAEIEPRMDGPQHLESMGSVDHELARRSCDEWTKKVPHPYGHGWAIVKVTADC